MKVKTLLVVVAVAALVLVAPLAVQAQVHKWSPPSGQGHVADVSKLTPMDPARLDATDLWFVELSKPPVADGGSLAAVKRDQKAFRAAAKQAGLQYTERFAFGKLWNGLSIKMDPAHLSTLTALPGVAAVYPVAAVKLPEGEPRFTPDLFSSIGMIGADVAQSSLGFTGAGVKVGVIDTGIDYTHPDLGGCFGNACRVAVGYDFVGDAYDGYNTPVPDADPMDCNGHGTHVSGIIGADGTVTGVAPEVTFGAYRVFGCEGSTQSDIMLAAMERAWADGMQVVNMSIGSAAQWPQYPTAMAATRLVNKGVVVVCSAGNEGVNNYGALLYETGAPAVGDKVISVASYDNLEGTAPAFDVNGTLIPYSAMTYSPPIPTSGSETIVNVGNNGCTASLPYVNDPSGKVALITRGTCSFAEKAANAEAAGAVAVVVYNNTAGMLFGTLGAPGITIPVVGITMADGNWITGEADPTTMTWTDQVTQYANANGGYISSFSSYGLSPTLAIKPDLGAPGGNIYSTYPVAKGSYAAMSGTSMSSPHVAGAAALLLQAKPNTPSQIVDTLLQNTAVPAEWWGYPGGGYLDSVNRQGAGMVQIDDAILATVKIEPGELALGESEAGPFNGTLHLENSGDEVTFDLSYESALATEGVLTLVDWWGTDELVEFNPASEVTVPAHGTADVDVTIYPPTCCDQYQYGGYIVFTPQGGGQVYRVPYAGFVGDYQSIQILTLDPMLMIYYEGSWYQNEGGDYWPYWMVGDDIPYIWVHLDHQARKLRMEVFDADTGKPWHRAYEWWYTSHNSSPTSFYAIGWDGTTLGGKKLYTVPNGNYVIKLSVQKALSNEWETWTSPVIMIDRP